MLQLCSHRWADRSLLLLWLTNTQIKPNSKRPNPQKSPNQGWDDRCRLDYGHLELVEVNFLGLEALWVESRSTKIIPRLALQESWRILWYRQNWVTGSAHNHNTFCIRKHDLELIKVSFVEDETFPVESRSTKIIPSLALQESERILGYLQNWVTGSVHNHNTFQDKIWGELNSKAFVFFENSGRCWTPYEMNHN